ncbi:MAG: sel1 repeat family protein [Clostridia bacterium]|nr:sel1 repeat family protein [Clostridia bacterium]
MDIQITNADINAINEGESNFINNKGAKLYQEETYEESIEYYRLAAAMGNAQSISNLGYCYLYGRSIPINVDLAIQYFKIAAKRGVIDAIYKLGDIYSRDKWGKKDTEMAQYYYQKGLDYFNEEYGTWHLYDIEEAIEYPSLFFALARESMPGGIRNTDIVNAYDWLKTAEKGYKILITEGNKYYEESYQNVIKLLDDPIFTDEIIEEFHDRYGYYLEENTDEGEE